MKKLNVIALAMLAGLISSAAWAVPVPSGSPRTFVSIKGVDQGACQNPCLTFQYALSQTRSGGEVIAVDSGNFGPVTITQSVTIEAAPGVYAGITQSGTNAGVTVNGTSAAIVVLRGLTIQGTGGSGDGIDFNSGAALHVENCVINGVGNYGIDHTGSGSLFVNDTVIRNSFNGVELDNSAAHEALSRVRLEFNISYGLSDDSGVASIANSVISDNGYIGISSGGSGAEVSVESCLLPHNFNGIANSGGGIIRVSNTTVTDGGGTGFYSGAGTFYSRQNNTVAGNFHDQLGTISPLGAI